ncbi:hypothetical protein NS365_05625 [Aureimonas ureilytica]|uniref:Uncharacterized protein n=1 Tax=Aureimonas ureilytica TaxID=401562 RepID=A0A175RVN7_9HYPH|nr:hypothetical protein NS365_05625 [Aureimonas ureilytica]
MVETLGEALRASWTVEVRCAFGNRDGLKSIRECHHKYQLDLATLVWTRGADCPLDALADRLKCPMCHSRRVRLVFTAPGSTTTVRASSGAW